MTKALSEKAAELGVCPAASDATFHGINKGLNAGRICWAVAGTFTSYAIFGERSELIAPGDVARDRLLHEMIFFLAGSPRALCT